MFALSLSYSLPVLTLAYFIFAVLSAEPTARGAFISAENETGSAVGEAHTPDEEYMIHLPFVAVTLSGSAAQRTQGHPGFKSSSEFVLITFRLYCTIKPLI